MPTASAFSLKDPRSRSDLPDQPSPFPQTFGFGARTKDVNKRVIIKNESHELLSATNEPNDDVTNNANEQEEDDRLLMFYQTRVPSHVRVVRRKHPVRHVNETDSEYELRYQYFEYAKLHPLTPSKFFYDIEVIEELLVPDTDSLSSTAFTEIDDEDENAHKFNSADDPYTNVWQTESIPNTLCLECRENLQKLSRTCFNLHPTKSIDKLPVMRDSSMESLMEYASSVPSKQKTKILLPPKRSYISKASKSVTFADPITHYFQSPSNNSNIGKAESRAPARALRRKESRRYLLPFSSSSLQSNLGEARSRTFYHWKTLKSQSSLEKPVQFRTFEEMFNRPISTPSKNLYGSKQQRKQLLNKYTFFMQQKRNSHLNQYGGNSQPHSKQTIKLKKKSVLQTLPSSNGFRSGYTTAENQRRRGRRKAI